MRVSLFASLNPSISSPLEPSVGNFRGRQWTHTDVKLQRRKTSELESAIVEEEYVRLTSVN